MADLKAEVGVLLPDACSRTMPVESNGAVMSHHESHFVSLLKRVESCGEILDYRVRVLHELFKAFLLLEEQAAFRIMCHRDHHDLVWVPR